uniref:Integrase catalytic domain-containing protein n=1 Tax=Neolamprologus brichardi TaxID=32507 RepID=A0A3Q4MNH0_NEOBR
MNSDVKKYVVSCCSCQATKPSQRKTAGRPPQRPWEYAGVDYVGPLPHTQRGNAYILVFVDYFSKWIEVSAVREATAQVAANKFITDIYARHGSPSYLISDRGTPFVSELSLTTAYHPQTNAIERVNRTLKTAIQAYVGNEHTSWDKYLPQICFALHTAPHESTSLSPSMMLYGQELDTPVDLVTQPSWDGLSDPETPYSDNLRASLRDAHEHARLVLEESHKRQKHYYDLRRRTVSYEVGDLVRVKSHPKSDALSNFSAKLAPLYTGPCRISKRMSDVNYCLTTVDTGEKVGVFHVANLQPFYTWATALSGKHAKLKAAAALDLGPPDSSLPPALSVPGRNDCDAVDTTPIVSSDTPAETDFDCTDTVPLFGDQNSFQETADIALETEVNSSPPADNGCAVRGSYNLRPRRVPRVTTDWSVNRWTNPFHSDIFDLK